MTEVQERVPGLRLCRLLGVPVHLQPSWFAFAAVVVVVYGDLLDERADHGYAAAGAFVVLLLVSVVLHELGHAAVARAYGLPVRAITVSFLAGLTEITEPPQTPGRECAVAVSGPLVSLVLGGAAAGGALVAADGGTVALVLQLVAGANLVVAVFNLLPGLPLDGGRVLKAGLWRGTGDEHRATVASARAGQLVGLLVLPTLLLLVAATGGQVTLATVAFGGLVAAFVCLGATGALATARAEQRLPALSAGALARHALPAPADLPLAEAVRRAHEHGLHAIVVVDAAGRPVALVGEDRVHAVPESRRPWVSIAEVARPLSPELCVGSSLSGHDLLAALRSAPATEYLVTDETGAPPRVLVAADVARALSP